MKITKPVFVTFKDRRTEEAFNILKDGKYEDKKLYEFIERARRDLKENPFCGINIPRRIWPKQYRELSNLRKYDLPNAWRLLYTIKTNEVEIINIILNWGDHKEYEWLFGY